MNFSTILGYITSWYERIIKQIQYLFISDYLWASIFFWAVIVYLIVFFVIIPLHKKFKKQRLKKEQEIVTDVDEMIYLLAKAQHTLWVDVRKLWGNPNIALMKSIFTKGNCDYIKSSYLILDNIHKVESLLWDKIISLDKESLLLKDAKAYLKIKSMETIFFWIAVIPTFGIYYLFK